MNHDCMAYVYCNKIQGVALNLFLHNQTVLWICFKFYEDDLLWTPSKFVKIRMLPLIYGIMGNFVQYLVNS